MARTRSTKAGAIRRCKPACAYWWWLNGNVAQEAITKDLEWMKAVGMGGALVFDAGGATEGGHAPVPAGPLFGSPPWRALFSHALREADRLGLEIGLNLQSGWNLGGPMVTPERAAKLITWSQLRLQGPTRRAVVLPQPPARQRFYRDTFVLAYRLKPGRSAEPSPATVATGPGRKTQNAAGPHPRPIQHLAEKSAFGELGESASDCTPLLADVPAAPGEEDVLAKDVLDLTDKLGGDGTLRWDAPDGAWVILRFGYTNNGADVSTASGAWNGLVIDYLDADALRTYWHAVVDPIIADAGPLVGRTWKMVQTDSWELGGVNWTASFPAEFKTRRGYDLRPWLPILAGHIVESRDASNRFLADFRRTIADCVAENHYGMMAALAHRHGLGIQPESAGPHTAPLDGLKCYGRSDWPMSEFWVPSSHRPRDEDRFFVKQAASAAHIYGQPIVCAEGLHVDRAAVERHPLVGAEAELRPRSLCGTEPGFLARLHLFAEEDGPAWPRILRRHAFQSADHLGKTGPRLRQLPEPLPVYASAGPIRRRRALLLRQPRAEHRTAQEGRPARVFPMLDYDVINEEVLLQASVANGQVVLPSGMAYRVLALPGVKVLSLEVARKLRDLVRAGATVVGPKPERTTGRQDDGELKRIADELWQSGTSNRGRLGRR